MRTVPGEWRRDGAAQRPARVRNLGFGSAVGGLLTLCALTGSSAAQRLNHRSFLNERPPELKSAEEHWLGWPRKLTLENLRGKVVWLQFNF